MQVNRERQNLLEQYTKKIRGRRLWKRFVRVVAGVVVFCTTYALILPAITMEQKAFCGLEEHVHDDACYTPVTTPTDAAGETAGHVHTDTCLDASGAVICGYHVHTDACYTRERGTLLCQQAEQEEHAHTEQCHSTEAVLTCQTGETAGHTHGEACYAPQQVLSCQLDEAEPHTHGDGCFDEEGTLICQTGETAGHSHGVECYTEQQALTCQLPEAESHTHGPDCWEYPLICGQTAAEGHTHNDDCYQWDTTLTCDLPLAPGETTPPQPELTCEDATHDHTQRCYGTWELTCGKEEHAHDLACFSDPNADVETREVWERTFETVKLTGLWGDDVVAIAESQLGYHESTRNYTVGEDGTTHGYTRYGDWYGSPYGDWCAMFASFCIHYAGVEGMPLNWGCRTWISDLSQPELDLYRPAADYTPKPGDLIFFDWEDADGNSDDLSDHVGIVAELLPATQEQPARIKTIEGNSSNQVKYNTYDQADTRILGYGVIPENPANGEPAAPGDAGRTYTYSGETLYVEVRLPEDTTVPADAVLWVTPIDTESADYAAYLARSEEAVEGLVAGIALYDISFYTPDGDYIPVSDTAEVTMGFTHSPVEGEGEIRVLHFAGEDTPPQVIDQVTIGEQELEMRLEGAPKDEPAPMALMEEAPTEPTEPTRQTETEPQTITERRTVVQFQTDGFSTFAVVQVENAYVTTILDDNAVMGDNHPLNGKILAISTRDTLTYNNQAAHRGLTRVATGDNHLVSLDVTRGDNTVTVSKSMLWKFEAVNGQANTYYVRPYDPVTKTASGYLQLQVNNQDANITVVPGNNAQDAYRIQVVQVNEEIRLKHATQGRYLSYDTGKNYFTDFQNPTADDTGARGAIVLSEYQVDNNWQLLPVTNLAGQKLAIVSVRSDNGTLNMPQAVTSVSIWPDDVTRLQGKSLTDYQLNTNVNGLLSIPGNLEENCFWTFEAVDPQNGVYQIKGSNSEYMQITNGGGTTAANPQEITVSSYKDNNGIEYVTLRVGDAFLNRYGGNYTDRGYVGWPDNNAGKEEQDVGNRFVLARREQFTAEVISREELWSAGRWTGNKLIFFVRQTDVYGTTRYYAMNVDGTATEIFLEPGKTLQDGAIIYADLADREEFLWNANGSPTGGWNSENNINGAIDLWPRNGDLVLCPNGDGGQGNANGAQPTGYVNPLKGTLSITSKLESEENWGWYAADNKNNIGGPLRALHNAAFQKVANSYQAGIDDTIASTIISDLQYDTPAHQYCLIRYNGEKFVAENANNFNQKTATDSTAFYVAMLNIPEEPIQETSVSHDTVVAKVLTRHELQDAAKMDDARLIFFTEQNDQYYALAYNGEAKEITALDNDLAAGKRFMLEGSADYNSNRILWDGTGTALDSSADNDWNTGKYVDLWLRNEATDRYLSTTSLGDTPQCFVTQNRPAGMAHAPGFYGLDGDLKSLLVTGNGDGGYVIKYDEEQKKYVVATRDGNQTGDPVTFYAALVTDDMENPGEALKVPAVKENVKMRLFNYGSAIDYYGKQYNGTTYNDNQNDDGNKDKDGLIYRFFHRPSFTGQAIDGTNEKTEEYATADAFEKRARNYSPTLGADNAPHISLEGTNATATKFNDGFSLGYLFGGNNQFFVASEQSLTLHQTGGGNWQEIQNATGTNINQNGTTAPAGSYNPINNPNYAVRSFEVTNNGEGTGLFQFDRTTGNYYYDSANNAAWYNPQSGKMELYNYALVPSGSLACIGGNFLPFNLGHEDGRLVPTDDGWRSAHTYGINDRTYQLNGIHHDMDKVIGRESMSDLWFGMTLEIEFTMTADGMLIPIGPNGQALDMAPKPMIFEFAGDDDVLVYVDDVLCLNIGGIHGAEYGDINFHTGEIHKQDDNGNKNAVQSTLALRFTAANKGNMIGENGLLKPWTKHTLKFFYLERGGNISNCRIAYNLADIPVGGMSVTKEVVGVDETQDYYGEYQFQLTDVELGVDSTTNKELYYTVRNQKGETVGEKHVFTKDALEKGDVKFTLKANETAEFFGFPVGTKLKVKELSQKSGQELEQVKFAGADGTGEFQTEQEKWTSDTITIQENNMQECRVTCTNQLAPVTVDITKTLKMLDGEPATGLEDKEFQFTYTITKPDGTSEEEQNLTVRPGTPTKIENVPFGSWLKIQEVTVGGYQVAWDYKVKPAETDATDAIAKAENVSDEDFQKLPGIHLLGDTEITCHNRMTFVEVQKTVEGNPTEEKYKFNYTVEYDNQEVSKGEFDIAHGETHRIPNLLLGSKVTVTEADGEYLTSYVITDWKPKDAPEPEAEAPAAPAEEPKKTEGRVAICDKVEAPQVIHFTNRPVYELPMTSGAGTQLYTVGGLLLMAAALLLYSQTRRRKGGHASP